LVIGMPACTAPTNRFFFGVSWYIHAGIVNTRRNERQHHVNLMISGCVWLLIVAASSSRSFLAESSRFPNVSYKKYDLSQWIIQVLTCGMMVQHISMRVLAWYSIIWAHLDVLYCQQRHRMKSILLQFHLQNTMIRDPAPSCILLGSVVLKRHWLWWHGFIFYIFKRQP
jgi:hypothetical protein